MHAHQNTHKADTHRHTDFFSFSRVERYLFEDDCVDMRVEDSHEDAGPNDGEEVEENEVVVVHDLGEDAGAVVVHVPAHEREEADEGPGEPAHEDDIWKEARDAG